MEKQPLRYLIKEKGMTLRSVSYALKRNETFVSHALLENRAASFTDEEKQQIAHILNENVEAIDFEPKANSKQAVDEYRIAKVYENTKRIDRTEYVEPVELIVDQDRSKREIELLSQLKLKDIKINSLQNVIEINAVNSNKSISSMAKQLNAAHDQHKADELENSRLRIQISNLKSKLDRSDLKPKGLISRIFKVGVK